MCDQPESVDQFIANLGGINVLQYTLEEMSDIYDVLRSILHPLGQAIRACGDRVDEIDNGSNDPDYIEAVVDRETELVEALLGSAFTVCQVQIAEVVSNVKFLHNWTCDHHGITLTSSDAQKHNIMLMGADLVAGSTCTKTRLIDTAANFFKHNSEWTSTWANAPTLQKRTVDVLLDVGVEEGSTGKLRTCSELIGNATYSDVLEFAVVLNVWREHVYNTYRAELVGHGLVS